MIILASFLNIGVNLLLVAHVVVVLLMILVIMMQRPKQEGLGAAFGGGLADAAWGAKTTDVLQKATGVLGTLFFVISFALAIMMGQQVKQMGLTETPAEGAKAEAVEGDESSEDVEPVDLKKALDQIEKDAEQSGEESTSEQGAVPAVVPETPADVLEQAQEAVDDAAGSVEDAVKEAVDKVENVVEDTKEELENKIPAQSP